MSNRRMSMPTDQFAQMQQQQQRQHDLEQMASQMAGVGFNNGSRRLSMPLGVIENTQQQQHNNNNNNSMMDLYAGYVPPQSQQQQQQLQQHASSVTDMLLQATSSAMDLAGNHIGNTFDSGSMYPSYNPSAAANQQQQQQQSNNRRMSMPSGIGICGSNTDNGLTTNSNNNGNSPLPTGGGGRRMSMPLSAEQQQQQGFVTSSNQQHGQQTHQHAPQQCRSNMALATAMGGGTFQSTSDQQQQHPRVFTGQNSGGSEREQEGRRGFEQPDIRGLDELADILRDDGELFDW